MPVHPIPDMPIAVRARTVSVSTPEGDWPDDVRWVNEHLALIRQPCGCLIDEGSGSLRAMPTCKGHMRDVERWSKLGMGWK